MATTQPNLEQWIGDVERHLAQRRELLQADLLGHCCDFGFDEVQAALQRAAAEYADWVKQHPTERQQVVYLKIALDMAKAKLRGVQP